MPRRALDAVLLVAEHDELAADLAEDDSITDAERKQLLKESPYTYRSYNPESMALYAERYSWYVVTIRLMIL